MGSQSLKSLVQEQAVDAVEPVDFKAIINFASISRIIKISAGCFVLFLGIIVFLNRHGYVSVYVQRMQGKEVKYPTRTKILEVTAREIPEIVKRSPTDFPLTVKVGQSVQLRALAGGKVPLQATLFMRPEKLHWQKLDIQQVEIMDKDRDKSKGTFIYQVDRVTQSFEFYFKIGDTQSQIFAITSIPAPVVKTAQVSITPPDYTSMVPYKVDKMNVEVPEGSILEWKVSTDTELEKAWFIVSKGEPVEMTIAADNKTCTFKKTFTQTVSYRFRWKRKDTGYNYDGSTHRVYVKPDSPPEVRIIKPVADVKGTIRKRLTIRFQAKDDYGIKKAWMIYAVNDGKEVRVDFGKLQKPPTQKDLPYPRYGAWTRKWRVKDSLPDLKPGDFVNFRIEVEEYNAEGKVARRHKSTVRKLEILNTAQYQKYIYARLAQVREQLAATSLEARRHQQSIRALTINLKKPRKKPEPKK